MQNHITDRLETLDYLVYNILEKYGHKASVDDIINCPGTEKL